MIVSVNPKPSLKEFSDLMMRTDKLLNEDAIKRPKYYASRGGNPLEDDVKAALDESAVGTSFAGTIEKVSGQRFPDIVAAKFYGVEVKSTKDDHWTSTGSSILETTRVSDVERIYMTFGKLGGNPIEFLSKPYEECLSGIAVTHMPRYLIDMRLNKGETIFDKMGIPYDDLRTMDNPISPVAKYYREQLKPGESLWWAGENVAEEVVPATMRVWHNVDADEKKRCVVYACVHFPEVFKGNYDRYSLWLASIGIVNSNVRDGFSAGGQEEMMTSEGVIVKMPAIYRRVKTYKDMIIQMLKHDVFVEFDRCDENMLNERILRWCKEVSKVSASDTDLSYDVLSREMLKNR
ncbi:MAG: hypothetical protein J5476_15330 [Lachnospiraceae bacterium]|nr:hypothetical protein [Lachnospiraceae bacterium]